MKKALPAIAIFGFFLSCSLPAAGQYSLGDRLYAAAERGDTAEVQSLLDKGADIEAKNADGHTALMIAADKDKLGVIELLLKNGANIDNKDKLGNAALMFAKAEGHADAVQFLLEKGANFETTDYKYGSTPLIWEACSHDLTSAQKIEITKLLLDKGANTEVEVKGVSVFTPLACANKWGPVEMVDLLEAAQERQKLLEEKEAQSMAPNERLAYYVRLLQHRMYDDGLREKIVQLAATLPAPPAIPEEARQLFMLAAGQITQASAPAALDQPIGLLRKVLEIAPWWGNAYYNLSLALEMRGQYDDAIRQMNYYLELKPAEADVSKARAHLTVLQTEKDVAAGNQQ